MKEFELKIGRKIFTISSTDRILFNGVSYILVTQSYRSGWNKINPTVSKANCHKWVDEGILVEDGCKKYGDEVYPLYRFEKEVTE